MELRCANGILAGVISDGMLEVSCKSKRCGKQPGIVVIHRYDLSNGQLIDTKMFGDPIKESNDNAC